MFVHSKASERSVRTLQLDFSNPRLIGYRKRGTITSEKDIVKVLATQYEAFEICRSILQNGFHPDEVLIAIPAGDGTNKLIVVEGNRRLSACKILLKPELLRDTPLKYSAERLKSNPAYEQAIKTIQKLNVVVLPGRREAAAYLASKHTKSPIKGWSPYTQGAYYMSLKSPDMTLSDIKESLNDVVPLDRIKKVVLFYRLSEFILDLECWTDEEKNSLLDNIDELKTEAIIRLIQGSEFGSSIGKIQINEHGDLIAKQLSEKSVAAILEKLARDAHFNKNEDGSNVINTRQEDKKEIGEYIGDLQSLIATNTNTENDDQINLNEESASPDLPVDDPSQPSKPSAQPPSRKWKKLLAEDLSAPAKHAKIRALVDDAQKLDTKRNPYSSALLARAIIEITLKAWLKQIGKEAELKSKYHDRAFDFENILKFTENNIKEIISDADAQKAIRQSISSLLSSGKEIMNLTNHNDIQILSSQELDHIRAKLHTISTHLFPLIE